MNASNDDKSFAPLPLGPAMQANLAQLGYTQMTPIQAASLPLALQGQDLIAQAQTGSGKTAAFGLALLQRLDASQLEVQSLVLCPTRELAEQVAQEIRRLARAIDNTKVLVLTGGSPFKPQAESLAYGAHIVVGTPGRLLDHLERGTLTLGSLRSLVLDEADRMLDMGFFDDIVAVAKQCPKTRQTLLFSATYPDGIAELAARFMREPKTVKVQAARAAEGATDAPVQIRQIAYEVTEGERLHAVSLALNHFRPESTLAFCNTKQQCRDLVEVLTAQGFVAMALHGDLEQRERDQVLIQFANRSCSVLVATDVAARGLDIEQLECVINVDITPDAEVHLHRIGRTGRAGAEGLALSFASLDEMGRIGRIEQALGREFQWQPLESLTPSGGGPLLPAMDTLQILGGRKEKIRPGDILGALTGEAGFAATQIGKIKVTDFHSYVAVERGIAREAVKRLSAGKLKGRKVKVRRMADLTEL